jgi:hypothetical protein
MFGLADERDAKIILVVRAEERHASGQQDGRDRERKKRHTRFD